MFCGLFDSFCSHLHICNAHFTFLSRPDWRRDTIKPHRFTLVGAYLHWWNTSTCLLGLFFFFFWPPRQLCTVLKCGTGVWTVTFLKCGKTLEGEWKGNGMSWFIARFFRKLHNKLITWSYSQDTDQIINVACY